MRGFLDDLTRSRRKHRPEKLRDFREALAEVDRHASERYFILKSIVIGNLYGVDLMEEAVEICKLRLFLKLVAQLEGYDQIEPLPDIDFNVRAGKHARRLYVVGGSEAGAGIQPGKAALTPRYRRARRDRGPRLQPVPRHADRARP